MHVISLLFCVLCFGSLGNGSTADVRSKGIFTWKIKGKFILIKSPTFYKQIMSDNRDTLSLTFPIILQECQSHLFSKSRNILLKFKALDKVHSISWWHSQNSKTSWQTLHDIQREANTTNLPGKIFIFFTTSY